MKKGLVKALAAALCLAMVLPAAGCKKKVANDANTLEIFIADFGYGTQWLYDIADKFRENHPDINVVIDTPVADQNMPNDKIMSGPTNTADLLFCASNNGVANFESGNYLDLTPLYETEIPGEGITVKEKMIDQKYNERIYTTKNGEEKIFSMPWVNGVGGLFINLDAYRTVLGDEYMLPRTTDELKKMCDEILRSQDKNNVSVYPFILGGTYYENMFKIWWAQYEGLESYNNFYEGRIVNDDDTMEQSPEIFAQTGRLRALEEVEELMGIKNGYVHPEAIQLDFMSIQALFYAGQGMMITAGDFIENEMKSLTTRGEITMMRNPVISTITEKLKDKDMTDEQLAYLVQCVDDEKDYAAAQSEYTAAYPGKTLDESDYDKIEEARNIVLGWNAHEAYIPSYAVAKEAAQEFLLYMATDEAIETFMAAGKGINTAFEYDVETKNPTLFDSFTTMQKDHARILKRGHVTVDYSQKKLVAKGGLGALSGTSLQTKFLSPNPNSRQTAQQVWQEDIDHYDTSKNSNWNYMIQSAGV